MSEINQAPVTERIGEHEMWRVRDGDWMPKIYTWEEACDYARTGRIPERVMAIIRAAQGVA